MCDYALVNMNSYEVAQVQNQNLFLRFKIFSKQFGFGCDKSIELSSVPSFEAYPLAPALVSHHNHFTFRLKVQFQALAHAPFIETEVLFASPQCFFTAMRVYVRSARLNRFYTYVKYITYSMDRKDIQYKCPQILQW